jgi:hypothetical protein
LGNSPTLAFNWSLAEDQKRYGALGVGFSLTVRIPRSAEICRREREGNRTFREEEYPDQ